MKAFIPVASLGNKYCPAFFTFKVEGFDYDCKRKHLTVHCDPCSFFVYDVCSLDYKEVCSLIEHSSTTGFIGFSEFELIDFSFFIDEV